jgi:hypothetical protein
MFKIVDLCARSSFLRAKFLDFWQDDLGSRTEFRHIEVFADSARRRTGATWDGARFQDHGAPGVAHRFRHELAG